MTQAPTPKPLGTDWTRHRKPPPPAPETSELTKTLNSIPRVPTHRTPPPLPSEPIRPEGHPGAYAGSVEDAEPFPPPVAPPEPKPVADPPGPPYCPAPGCGEDSKVIDSRPRGFERRLYRRRECLKCGHRFSTYESYGTGPAPGYGVVLVAQRLRRMARLLNRSAELLAGEVEAAGSVQEAPPP